MLLIVLSKRWVITNTSPYQCLERDRLVILNVNKKLMSLRGQASWMKMTSPGCKLNTLACHRTKKVNKAEELTSISTNIDYIYYASILAIS